jgi:hypothetical protein
MCYINETPNFISTVGLVLIFLKLTIPILLLSSGAVAIAGITTDYDNEVRAGNTGLPFKLMVQECTDIELMSLMENYPM